MLAYLKALPPDVDPLSVRKLAIQEVQTSSFTFYQALKELEGTHNGLPFKSILPILEQKGSVIFEPFPIERVKFFPDLIIFISPEMKNLYRAYGKFVSIDFTYNLIKETPFEEEDLDENKTK